MCQAYRAEADSQRKLHAQILALECNINMLLISLMEKKTTPNVPNQFLKSHHLDTYHKKLIPITG